MSKLFKKELPFSIGAPALIWQMLFFYVPLFLIAVSSIIKVSKEGYFESLTLGHFAALMKPTYARIIFRSLALAFCNGILCLGLAYPLAYFLAFRGKKFKNVLLFLLIVPFWTNFLLHVYAWFYVLERKGFLNNLLMNFGLIQEPLILLNTLFAIVLMMVYYYLPFMVLPIYTSLERFDLKLLEASLDLGASWFQTFRRVLLPLSWPGVQAGFFLVFIPSFGEFAIPELMGGDKQFFVGSVVSHYILGEETGSLGAAFTVLSSIALLMSAVLIYFLMKRLFKPAWRK
jgi:spermidine/putrescine transport system permease protein